MSFINKRPTKVEVFHYYNSLVCIPKALIGRYTLIDLRDDSCVSGRITDVDGYMNVQMEDVVFYNNRGSEYAFETFFVHSRNLRYIHIPKGLSPIELLQNEIYGLKTKPVSDKTKTFKTKRAERYTREIEKSLAEKK